MFYNKTFFDVWYYSIIFILFYLLLMIIFPVFFSVDNIPSLLRALIGYSFWGIAAICWFTPFIFLAKFWSLLKGRSKIIIFLVSAICPITGSAFLYYAYGRQSLRQLYT